MTSRQLQKEIVDKVPEVGTAQKHLKRKRMLKPRKWTFPQNLKTRRMPLNTRKLLPRLWATLSTIVQEVTTTSRMLIQLKRGCP